MKHIQLVIRYFLIFGFLMGVGVFLVKYYPWVFSKRVKGEIMDVQRVTNPTAIISGKVTDAQIHSYSVLIKAEDGKLYTASSEDRQWQVASKGYCVEALLYRYPPWDLEKAGTFFNARIMELKECPGKEGQAPAAPGTPSNSGTVTPGTPPNSGAPDSQAQ